MWDKVKVKFLLILVGIAVIACFLLGKDCGAKSRDSEVQKLSAQLAENEKTIKVKDDLYATKIVEITNLNGLLDTSKKEVSDLKKELDATHSELLSTQELVLSWKKAYEGALKATQKTPDKVVAGQPPAKDPGREEVDFTGQLGPILATGHTLTNPPEAYLKLEQTVPLVLTVNVAKNKDGTWSSYVTTSDKNIDVKVKLGGVDPGVVSPTWKQRIWLDLGADFLGDIGGRVGASYRFDNWSIGPSCYAGRLAVGCGVSVGFRLFR